MGIRMLTVNTQTSTTPLDDIGGVKYKAASTWLPSEPHSFGMATFSYPSAVCYYFAKNLYHQLNGTVPIGIGKDLDQKKKDKDTGRGHSTRPPRTTTRGVASGLTRSCTVRRTFSLAVCASVGGSAIEFWCVNF